MDVATASRRLSRPEPHGRDGQFRAPAGMDVVEELGRVAQTIVYRVRRDAREYALKVLQTTAGDDEALDRLCREAARLACVDHPGTANVYERPRRRSAVPGNGSCGRAALGWGSCRQSVAPAG